MHEDNGKVNTELEIKRLEAKKEIHEAYANAIMWAAFWLAVGVAFAFG